MSSQITILNVLFRGLLNDYDEDAKERIRISEGLIKEWVKDLYWEILEETRNK